MNDSIPGKVRGLAMVMPDTERRGLPEPIAIHIDAHRAVEIHLDSLDDLYGWAEAAGAKVTHGEPGQYGDRWTLHHRATGAIFDLPVRLTAVEFGVMVEPETYVCESCGADFGVSGGFVPEGSTDDGHGWFEAEVARHQDGKCVSVAVAAEAVAR